MGDSFLTPPGAARCHNAFAGAEARCEVVRANRRNLRLGCFLRPGLHAWIPNTAVFRSPEHDRGAGAHCRRTTAPRNSYTDGNVRALATGGRHDEPLSLRTKKRPRASKMAQEAGLNRERYT